MTIVPTAAACCVVLAMGWPWSIPVTDQNDTSVSSDSAGQSQGLKQGVVGRVTNAAGQPVSGVMIQAVSLGASGPPIPEIAILSGRDGRYAWSLQPGDYELTPSIDGQQGAALRVTVRANKVATLDFQLD